MSDIDDPDLAEMLKDEIPVGPSAPASTPAPVRKAPTSLFTDDDYGDSPDEAMAANGLKREREVPDITQPWMAHHKFVLVGTPEEVERIVDDAIANGRCSLDLETEGLDGRTFVKDGKLRTVHQIVGYCIAVGEALTGYYIPVRHKPLDGGPTLNVEPVERVEAAITRLCLAAQPKPAEGVTDPLAFREFSEPPKVIIDFWNAKFDQEMLYPITGIDYWHPDSFEDGNLAYFVMWSGDRNLGLKDKAEEVLRDPEGHPYKMIELKQLFPNRRKVSFPSLSPDEPGVIKYACSDAICTRLLCGRPDLLPAIAADGPKKSTYRLEKQVSQVVRVVERNRVKVDRSKLMGLRDSHRQTLEEYRAKIIKLAASRGFHSFEPGSPKQLGEFLFSAQGLNLEPKPPMNEASGQYKTDYETIRELGEKLGEAAPEVLKWVIAYREEDKILGTYLESLSTNPDVNDEIRVQFKQTGAATGRFSAPAGDADQGFSGIPIHGIPSTSDLRTCFVARDGYTMLKCDYAGEELRIVANLSNEPVWVKEFLEGDGDLHTITARALYGKQEVTKDERKAGKAVNFALAYGGGPASIQRSTGCTKPEAQRRKQNFDKSVPTFTNWVKGQQEKAKKLGGVYTAFGRWIAMPEANIRKGDINPNNGKVVETEEEAHSMRAAAERQAVNYPIQGSGSDIMKIVMVLLHKEFYRRGWLKNGQDAVRMLLTVHDEIVFEVRHDLVFESVPLITSIMERPTHMTVRPYSPPWKVPLVTDPLIGESWGAEYKCHRAKAGEKPPSGGFVAYGYIYEKVPAALTPYIPTAEQGQGVPDASPIRAQQDPTQAVAQAQPEAPPRVSPQTTQTVGTATETSSVAIPTATLRLKILTPLSVAQVRGAIERHRRFRTDPDQGSYLRLTDPWGNVLIDPKMKIRVKSQELARSLLELNLSDGLIGEESPHDAKA